MKRTFALCAAFAMALSMTACSSDEDASEGESTGAAVEATSSAGPDAEVVDSETPLFEVAGDKGEEPTITFDGEAPESLQRYVMDENPDGEEIGPNDAVLAYYHGQVWDGDIFDSAYQRHEPIAFPLTGVIEGWQKGLTGTRVGERVQLVIPSAQGYPDGTPDGSIKPGDTIVFVVEVQGAASLDSPGDTDAEAVNDPASAGVKVTRDEQGRLQSAELLDKGVDMDPENPVILFNGSDTQAVGENDQVALRMVRLTKDQPQADTDPELQLLRGSQLPAVDKLHVGSVIAMADGKAGEMASSAIVFEVVKIFTP